MAQGKSPATLNFVNFGSEIGTSERVNPFFVERSAKSQSDVNRNRNFKGIQVRNLTFSYSILG